jgi:hypothetical protein
MTDLYPDEEGHIADGLVIGFCKVVDGVEINEAVGLGLTAVSGVVSIIASAADGDAVGIALKSGVTNDYVPVCFYGIVKMYAGDTITAGDIVKNDATGTFVLPIAVITDTTGVTGWTAIANYKAISHTGTAWRLGLALQNGATTGDELLMLVGGLR